MNCLGITHNDDIMVHLIKLFNLKNNNFLAILTIYQWWIQDFLLGGGTDLQCGHFSAEMYGKMKELGPVCGGGARVGGTPLDPPMFTFHCQPLLKSLGFWMTSSLYYVLCTMSELINIYHLYLPTLIKLLHRNERKTWHSFTIEGQGQTACTTPTMSPWQQPEANSP